MSRRSIGDLHANITANSRTYVDEFRKADRANAGFAEGVMRRLGPALTLVGGSAGGFSVAAAGAISFASEIKDLSDASQTGMQAFQAISLEALDSGVKMDQVSRALVTMVKNVEEAASGSTAMSKSLEVLNLKAGGLRALAPEEMFEVIGRRILQATDQSAAFGAALDLIGSKNAPRLLETLKKIGSEGLPAIMDLSKSMRVSDDDLKTLDDAGDKLARIWHHLKVIGAKGFSVAAREVEKFDDARRQAYAHQLAKNGSMMLDGSNVRQEFKLPSERASPEFDEAKRRSEQEKKMAEAARVADVNSALTDFFDSMDKQATKRIDDEVKSLLQFAEKIVQDTRTPLEKFGGIIDQLAAAAGAGLITTDQFNRASRSARGEYLREQDQAVAPWDRGMNLSADRYQRVGLGDLAYKENGQKTYDVLVQIRNLLDRPTLTNIPTFSD